MKFAVLGQSLKERIALAFGLAPLPVVHSNMYAHCARALCEAVALGVFEAIGLQERTAQEIAEATKLDAHALEALLHLLVPFGYLAHREGKFRTTALTRKWLLEQSDNHICDAVRLFRSQRKILDHLPEYLRTGKGYASQVEMHADDWHTYQKAMFQLARMGVKEVAAKTPVPPGATSMLDVGGSHGLYSVALCRRVPTLRSEVLELPEAIAAAAALLAAINDEQRVLHRAGNVLEDDLGEDRYDVVFMANVVHLFDADDNRRIAQKVGRALKKGGHFIIQDFVRPPLGAASDMLGSVQNLFFSLTSAAGVYSLEEEQDWQKAAGLEPLRVTRFLSSPLVQVTAVKGGS